MNTLIRFLGPDLAYEEYPELAVNIKHVGDDYYLKKWHQEFWSGNGSHTIQLWFPIAIEENMGGLELVRGSHLWGHIPHRNREPVHLFAVSKAVAVGIGYLRIGLKVDFIPVHQTVAVRICGPRVGT